MRLSRHHRRSLRRKRELGRRCRPGLRHGTVAPSAIAASRPERSPSSWKPWPVQAPANEVRRTPWISSRRACADSARASNCGCAKLHSPNVSSSARLDRRVERDEQRHALVDALQPVHPVGDADVAVVALACSSADSSRPPRRRGASASAWGRDAARRGSGGRRSPTGSSSRPARGRRASPAPGRCAPR